MISTSVNANCFEVTELQTSWQKTLSNFYINVGERYKNTYTINLQVSNLPGSEVEIAPGKFHCLLYNYSVPEDIVAIECGFSLSLVELGELIEPIDSSNNTLPIISATPQVSGDIRETWILYLQAGIALLVEVNENPKNRYVTHKEYHGQVKRTC